MPKPNVVIIGQVCIDHNETEHAVYTGWGSTALYMADYCQRRLGITPYIITTFGTDFAPYIVDFRRHPSRPTAATTLVYKNVIRGNDRQWFCENEASAVPPKLTPDVRELIAGADILILAALLANYPPAYVQKVFSLAKPGCLKVLAAQGYLRQKNAQGKIMPRDFAEAQELLPLFDITIYSSDDYPNGIGLAQSWQQDIPGVRDVIVTEGPRGACIVRDGSTRQVPTSPIAEEEIVDSVGCGDIFAMALAYNYYTSRDLVTAIIAAHQAARAKLLASVPVPTSM